MTSAELWGMAPLIVLFAAPVILLVIIAFYRHHGLTLGVTVASLAASLVLLVGGDRAGSARITDLLVMDGYSVFFVALLLASAIVVALLSYQYLEASTERKEEYYPLLLVATLGGAVLVASTHFASLFLGLEILGISLYALIGYQRERVSSVEASMKYLILAAVGSAFLLFGMALVYGETGSLEFSGIVQVARASRPLFLVGISAMIVGLGFKLALVPFHMWTADVYQGAPAPVTAFIASVSKGAAFALVLRLFSELGIDSFPNLAIALTVIAVLSMFTGNLLALMQKNVKRMLAYSSIAHIGYLLVALLAASSQGMVAVGYYLVAYSVTILGAFGVVCVLSGPEGEAENIDQYRGLSSNRPWLAAVFAAMLLSLAGIPLTAGFLGKFYLVVAGIGSSLWILVMSLVVTSVIGLYYYLRLIFAMYAGTQNEPAQRSEPDSIPVLSRITLAVLSIILVLGGVYPGPIIDIIRTTVAALR